MLNWLRNQFPTDPNEAQAGTQLLAEKNETTTSTPRQVRIGADMAEFRRRMRSVESRLEGMQQDALDELDDEVMGVQFGDEAEDRVYIRRLFNLDDPEAAPSYSVRLRGAGPDGAVRFDAASVLIAEEVADQARMDRQILETTKQEAAQS